MWNLVDENGRALSKTVKILKMHEDVEIPTQQTSKAAGYDVCAYTPEAYITILPGHSETIHTGIKMQIPDNYYIALVPRSGLAFKKGITLANSPATIDADFTGELLVCLRNEGEEKFEVYHGDRIAQMILLPSIPINFVEVDTLEETDRGESGFGSTKGVKNG